MVSGVEQNNEMKQIWPQYIYQVTQFNTTGVYEGKVCHTR